MDGWYKGWYAIKPNQPNQPIRKNKFSCIIHADILEFVAVELKLDVAFVQLCIGLYGLKMKIFIIYMVS